MYNFHVQRLEHFYSNFWRNSISKPGSATLCRVGHQRVATSRAARRRTAPGDPRRPCPRVFPTTPQPEAVRCPRTPRTSPPYARRVRSGLPVRPRRRPYVRRSRRRSTADAPRSSSAITRARVYIRAPCALLPHAIPSRQPRRTAPLPPPPERRLLRPSPFQPAPLASPLGPSAPPRVAHSPPRAVYSPETAPPRPPPPAAVELLRRRPPCPNPGHQ
jgi:hypothetical protein